MTIGLRCVAYGRTYDIGDRAWRCSCGGLFKLEGTALFAAAGTGSDRPWSLWRYRNSLPIFGSRDRWEQISLGEGSTPIVQDSPGVLLKLDFLMPTLSFKDRGSVVLVSAARELGVRQMVADSSGNAGVSIAAYGARAGIETEVFVPSSTSPSKVLQLEAYGAVVRRITGSRDDTAAAAISSLEQTGAFYASHVYNPFFHHGTKTFAFECYEQLAGLSAHRRAKGTLSPPGA
ncbi:MAG: pyridoxal-phosphate dependent enzyme [Acidimicrobiales bacterium]